MILKCPVSPHMHNPHAGLLQYWSNQQKPVALLRLLFCAHQSDQFTAGDDLQQPPDAFFEKLRLLHLPVIDRAIGKEKSRIRISASKPVTKKLVLDVLFC